MIIAIIRSCKKGGTMMATYWLNGKKQHLTDGTEFGNALAVSMDSTNNVYVAGYITKNQMDIAQYWKNGEVVNITDGKFNSRLNEIVIQ